MTELSFVVVGLTSGVACAVGARVLRRSPAALREAIGLAMESLGVATAFYLLNGLLAAVFILAFRWLTGRPMSLYFAAELVWLPLALLQGLIFHWWWRGKP